MFKKKDNLPKKKRPSEPRIVGVYQPILPDDDPGIPIPPKGGTGARYLKLKGAEYNIEKNK